MLFAKASKIGMKVDSIVITKEMQEQIEENSRKYEEKLLDKKDFDFTILYNPDAQDEMEEKKQYHTRILEVKKLITAGYSYSQIRGMKPLLMVGYTSAAIKELFGVNEPVDGIRNVIEILEE